MACVPVQPQPTRGEPAVFGLALDHMMIFLFDATYPKLVSQIQTDEAKGRWEVGTGNQAG
uniref:Uncharacterized protein n=1 Tax=Oryza brachyantha TaxID=4533 RepID=J3N0H2_ORYBR